MKREFIYTNQFEKIMNHYKFSEIDERKLENTLLQNPELGDVVQGTGGLRKFRFSINQSNAGKSGSFRIFYLDLEEYSYIIFMAILKKKENDNLSDEEKKILKRKIDVIKKFY